MILLFFPEQSFLSEHFHFAYVCDTISLRWPILLKIRCRFLLHRPFFKEEFATESDNKLISDGLAHMAMRPTKNIRDFFGRLNKVNTIILDAYKGYTLTPPEAVLDANANISLVAHRAHNVALVENVVEFYLLNQFWAALPVDLRRVIKLQRMHTLDLDTAVCLATIELCSKDEARGTSQIQAVQQDEEVDGVDAVTQNCQKKFFPQNQQNKGQQNCQNFWLQNNNRNNQNLQQWRNNKPGDNFNRNKMTCIFCRKQEYQQEDCTKSINSNQPCLDCNGKSFWPKINMTKNGAPIQALQDQGFQY
jgi:hypothetical protein